MNISPAQKLIGALLALSCLTTACGGGEQKAAGPPAIPVKLQTLRTGTLINSSEFVGTLEARQRVSLAPSRTNGRIVRIFAKQGDAVRRGQKVIEIQPQQAQENVRTAIGNLQVAKANLIAAEAELRQREAERDRAKSDVERSQESVAREQANVQDIKAQLALAEVDYKRSVFLVKEGVRPQQDLDNNTTNLRTTRARLQAQTKAFEEAKAALRGAVNTFQAADKRVVQARANVESQRGAIAAAQGELGATEQQLEYNFILAPIDGVVGDFNQRKVGDNVNIGEQITTITDNQILELNLNIPIEFQSRLRVGLPVEVINPDGTAGVRGQLTYIAPLADRNAQTTLVKFAFRNDGSLKDEQYVRVRVIWDLKPGLLVPTTAITSLGGQKFVFVAARDGSEGGEAALVAKQIPVEVGSIQGQAYQVLSGIKAGDRIAVSRILDLKDGTAITEE